MPIQSSAPVPVSGGSLSRYRPKSMSVKQLYNHLNERSAFERHDRLRAHDALKQAGYSRTKITNLLDRHFEIPGAEMRKIAGHLKEGNVSGFRDTTPQEAVKRFIRAEMVRGRSINIIKKEHQQEMRSEDLEKKQNTVSLSSLERMTKSNKPGRASSLKLTK